MTGESTNLNPEQAEAEFFKQQYGEFCAFMAEQLPEHAHEFAQEAELPDSPALKWNLDSHQVPELCKEVKVEPAMHQNLALLLARNCWAEDIDHEYLDSLQVDYSQKFADALFEYKGTSFLAANIGRFNDIQPDAELAERLIDANSLNGYDVLKNKDAFAGFAPDMALAQKMFDSGDGGGEAVTSNLDAFNVPKDETFFKAIVAGASGQEALECIDKFPGLQKTPELGHFIARHNGGEAFLRRADEFGVARDAQLAAELLERGVANTVTDNIAQFEGLNKADMPVLLAAGLLGGYNVNPYDMPKHFEGLNLDGEYASMLIHNPNDSSYTGPTANFVTNQLHLFSELTAQHAYDLIEKGQAYVIHSSQYFEGLVLDNKFALHMIHNGLGGFVEDALDKFQDLDSECLAQLWSFYETDESAGIANESDLAASRNKISKHLFRFAAATPSEQVAATGTTDPFPNGGSLEKGWGKAQREWFARNSYASFSLKEWPADKIGGLIGNRIRLGLERDVHDASQWLNDFDFYTEAYDTASILRDRLNPDFDPEQLEKRTTVDIELERAFITSLVYAPHEMRQRLALSGKPQSIQEMFSLKEHALAYEILLGDYNGGPLYKSSELTAELFHEKYAEAVYAAAGPTGQIWVGKQEDRLVADHAFGLNPLDMHCDALEVPPSVAIKQLRELGQARQRIVNDTTEWLLRHQTSPRGRLTKTWGDRALALANGVETLPSGERIATVQDSAQSIGEWQRNNELKAMLHTVKHDDEYKAVGLTPEVIMSEALRPARTELLRVLSADDSLLALRKLRKWQSERTWDEKVLPARSVSVEVTDKSKPWKVEILDKDDIRGFTIGEDTACCMTIHGASNSCIKAGYKLKEAGFLAAYNPDGKLAAQSFWYVHPNHPETLVLDNIEAGAGKDTSKIISVYQAALTKMLSEARGDAARIKNVHLGEGYTTVDYSDLEIVKRIPKMQKVYTDADRQRSLLKLRPAQLNKAVGKVALPS